MSVPIQTVLVPQGAEYRAVCRGLRQASSLTVLPIPVGSVPLTRYLKTLEMSQQSTILVAGLCGSLTGRYRIGDAVLYQKCISTTRSPLLCDAALTELLQQKLADQADQEFAHKLDLVRAWTSDRVIWSAAEKRSLSNEADVVDMEGYAVLEFFSQLGTSVAMLRVVSDDCQHDLPDLTSAFSADGALQPLPLAVGMLKQPIAATRLIRGSLQGLKALQQVIATLFNN